MRPTLLAALAAVSVSALPLAAQQKTDTYLQLLSSAVSAYSAGNPVWIVICDVGGQFKTVGGFASEGAANEVKTAKNLLPRTTCYVEGPYTSTVTYTAQPDMQGMPYGTGCKKGPDSDCMADSTGVRSFIGSLSSIAEVTLTYRFRDGRPPVVERFDPRSVEAIFFTMPAVDRMLMPYYVRVYGLGGAMTRRRDLLGKFGGRDVTAP